MDLLKNNRLNGALLVGIIYNILMLYNKSQYPDQPYMLPLLLIMNTLIFILFRLCLILDNK